MMCRWRACRPLKRAFWTLSLSSTPLSEHLIETKELTSDIAARMKKACAEYKKTFLAAEDAMPGSPREILRRIRGIKSTQQITRAMQMVSAVKLTRVARQAETSRPYVSAKTRMMRTFRTSAYAVDHPVFNDRRGKQGAARGDHPDRGLCGTFNT